MKRMTPTLQLSPSKTSPHGGGVNSVAYLGLGCIAFKYSLFICLAILTLLPIIYARQCLPLPVHMYVYVYAYLPPPPPSPSISFYISFSLSCKYISVSLSSCIFLFRKCFSFGLSISISRSCKLLLFRSIFLILPFCVSPSDSLYLCLCLSACKSVDLYFTLPVCLPVCLSACLFLSPMFFSVSPPLHSVVVSSP